MAKRRGRPKGSKNKTKLQKKNTTKPEKVLEETKATKPKIIESPKKRRGRPKGSKNKSKTLIEEMIEVPQPRVTKFQEEVQKAREALKVKANKRKTPPGPWSDIDPPIQVNVKLRASNGIMGEMLGTYPKKEYAPPTPKGWYAILFNITSKSIRRDIEEHGIDNYLAACEDSLNTPANQKLYGKVVLLKIAGDHSDREERDQRFVSVYAKTNKFTIKGFTAIRQNVYQVLP